MCVSVVVLCGDHARCPSAACVVSLIRVTDAAVGSTSEETWLTMHLPGYRFSWCHKN